MSDVVFNGVRFHLSEPAYTTKVGGHFVSTTDGDETFFGAVIRLDDQDDFPDSGDLTSSDVLGATALAFPEPSAEVFADLALRLEPGWYGLVFGAGLFGTSGEGAALLNNPDIADPSYIGFQPGFGWSNRPAVLNNKRYVIRGYFVPEPPSWIAACALAPCILATVCKLRGQSHPAPLA